MASYKNTGDQVLEFPTLVLAVKPGETFEAPDNLVAEGVVAVNAAPKKSAAPAPTAAPATDQPTPSASSDTTAGA